MVAQVVRGIPGTMDEEQLADHNIATLMAPP